MNKLQELKMKLPNNLHVVNPYDGIVNDLLKHSVKTVSIQKEFADKISLGLLNSNGDQFEEICFSR